MTKPYAESKRREPRKGGSLTLRQLMPNDWHNDRPAFAGDPFMDWESGPEPPPKPPQWGFKDEPVRGGERA